MADVLSQVSIEKCDVGLELVELEEAAKLALEEDGNTNDTVKIEQQLGQLNLEKSNKDNSGSSESSEGSTDSDDVSSTSQSDSEIDSDDDETDGSTSSSESEDDCLIFGKDESSHERRR